MHYIDSHVHVWTDTFDRYPLDPGTKVEEMGDSPIPSKSDPGARQAEWGG